MNSAEQRFTCIVCLCCAILSYPLMGGMARSEEAIAVKSDSDKTVYSVGASDGKNNSLVTEMAKEKNVYSIGSGKTRKDGEALKQERSWDMLMHIGIWQEDSDRREPKQEHPRSHPGDHKQSWQGNSGGFSPNK